MSANGEPVLRVARPVMGTVASIHVFDDDVAVTVAEAAVEDVFVELERLEQMFSTFRPSSEISRFNRGELALPDCSTEVIDVFDACTWLERVSDGAFDIRPRGLGGPVDPAGFVKGWAAERASRCLSDAGLEHWYLSVGGDIVHHGRPGPGRRWVVGLADPNRRPDEPPRVRATIEIDDGAVATSGTAERGSHLWDRRPDRDAPDAFVSLTVIGPSLTWADAFATTAFVMGEPGLAWLRTFDGYTAVAIRADGTVTSTSGIAEAASA